MQPAPYRLALALLMLPLTTKVVAIPAITSAHVTNPGSTATKLESRPIGPEIVDSPTHHNEHTNTGFDDLPELGVGLETRDSFCGLYVNWKNNWDEGGRRYRVIARAVTFGLGQPREPPKMIEDWAFKCRSIPNEGWEHNAQAWLRAPGSNQAACDITFVHGPLGHDQYLAWHKAVGDHWRSFYPECFVEQQL
ncbi:uncharacterized protein B0I36DRAFT_247191 [Microdochium trichocladiopsis]|uniref:Secreted protein n=1 Tax=Microdochium trichocladiopsis TaxID=1682393 RepID=A0A9P9BP33_9PEZI|nr:uncharacterized protein B0I36DRAFT_247191 [Microdochium trichocladiopsis]KAH7028119.1 hypothetical protein B0I36DRAFT_247191 [Microdochium trichocladiopsis]